MKRIPAALLAEIKRAKKILIISHIDPDCDATGSALALKRILAKKNKAATLFCASPISTLYKFLPGVGSYTQKLPKGRVGLSIALDCGAFHRTGIPQEKRGQLGILANIDHHSDNALFGDINYIVNVSATAELVYYLARALKVAIDPHTAACLYAAIMTDTGNFCYDNVSAATFGLAQKLVEAGARTNFIAQKVYENRSLSAMKMLGLALESIEAYERGAVAMVALRKGWFSVSRPADDDTNGIIDHIRAIAGVEVAVLLREMSDGRIKVNFRSKGHANVQKIARTLGGGGHIRASGAILRMPLFQAKKRILRTIHQNL